MTKKINKREIRALNGEMRAESEGRTVEGYAALYNQETDLGFFREVILPGAFDGADMSDVRALFNHEPNHILARTASGTLRLSADERGLKYEFEAPNTTLGNDLLEMIRRGDISQSSFAFTVKNVQWEEERGKPDLRKIEKFDRLFDVSPVTYPAYPQTTAQARSLEQIVTEEHPGPDEEEETGPDEFEKQQREMDERVRSAQFSLIQTSVNNDH